MGTATVRPDEALLRRVLHDRFDEEIGRRCWVPVAISVIIWTVAITLEIAEEK